MINNKMPLKDLCIEDDWGKYGIPATAEDYDITKIRYLSITDISDDGELLNNDKKSISAVDIEKYLLKEGDIVFARTGNSTGRTYYHEDKKGKLAFAGFLIKYAVDKNKINPKYLKFYTQSNEYKKWVENLSVGSTRGNINAQTFADCPISVPDRKQQDLLVATLSLLVDKIDLNNRINAELEAMAKTLYDYWFVQFDFPDKNGKPYKSSGGKMVWNKELKREIPVRWKVWSLNNLVELVKGNVSPFDIDASTPYVGLEHIGRKTVVLSDWATPNSANSDKTAFKKNDILFGKIRPYFHKVAVAPFDGITSTDTIILRPKKKCFLGFALETVFSDEFVVAATLSSTGSKMPRADWNVLQHYKIPVSKTDLLEAYQSTFEEILKKISLSVIENKKLSDLRDWLLPMLMNGQVTVS